MKVERWDPEDDETLSEQTLRRKLEKLGYRVNRYVYSVGTRFPVHSHEVDKMDAVLSGEFRITINGESVVLGPGDAIEVPHGVEHSAEVVGDRSVVSLDGEKKVA
ncbi:MAG TPA: cupin domain-containing protein [Terriglobales bacterium]|nr:cupin domain-containing protein [Terriglobales bacterium]